MFSKVSVTKIYKVYQQATGTMICWYTLDQYGGDLIGFTNVMKNIEAETDTT